jgi:hypothetical protein
MNRWITVRHSAFRIQHDMLGVHVFYTSPMWRKGVQKSSDNYQSIPYIRVRSDHDRLGRGEGEGGLTSTPHSGVPWWTHE